MLKNFLGNLTSKLLHLLQLQRKNLMKPAVTISDQNANIFLEPDSGAEFNSERNYNSALFKLQLFDVNCAEYLLRATAE